MATRRYQLIWLHLPYRFITIELDTIIHIHFAVPGAVAKLFIELSASATDRQWTMTSQLLSPPGADSRDKKPERLDT